MQLITLPLSKIKPYAKNPRNNDGAVDAVAESIRQCGYVAPIVVDENNEILAGHTRYKALKKLGRKDAQVIVKDGLTDEQKRKYRLLDNKTAELAEWDFDLLDDELKSLDFDGFDFGFDMEWPTFDETGLDAEESEDGKISCKFTFESYKDYAANENKLKALADSMGALFSVNKA